MSSKEVEELPTPTKSTSDVNEYKVIKLKNGLTAILIADNTEEAVDENAQQSMQSAFNRGVRYYGHTPQYFAAISAENENEEEAESQEIIEGEGEHLIFIIMTSKGEDYNKSTLWSSTEDEDDDHGADKKSGGGGCFSSLFGCGKKSNKVSDANSVTTGSTELEDFGEVNEIIQDEDDGEDADDEDEDFIDDESVSIFSFSLLFHVFKMLFFFNYSWQVWYEFSHGCHVRKGGPLPGPPGAARTGTFCGAHGVHGQQEVPGRERVRPVYTEGRRGQQRGHRGGAHHLSLLGAEEAPQRR